jgi:nucleotide-binding universal stress UspA family protein
VILLHVLLRNLALRKVYELARAQNVPSHVLERLEPAAPPVYDFESSVPAAVVSAVAPTELLVDIGRRIIDAEKRAIEGQGVKQVDVLIEDDDAASKILEVASREGAEFIVLGRRGVGALEGILSGSVSTKVSHLAPATVVSVT